MRDEYDVFVLCSTAVVIRGGSSIYTFGEVGGQGSPKGCQSPENFVGHTFRYAVKTNI